MKESIVKVPRDKIADYDFIAFSFNGKHSYEDFGIYRVADGERYNIELNPQMNDKTAEIPGLDGMIYYGNNYKSRVFNINFAFDNLTEDKLQELKKWLNGREIADLWFAEAPYKVYSAKVTAQPNIKVVVFDDIYMIGDEKKTRRIYKGEGTVQFTCYYPFAHTPDYVIDSNNKKLEGNYHTSYSDFHNYSDLLNAGVLPGTNKEAYGDLPFNFIAKLDNIEKDRKILMKVDVEGTEYDIIGDNPNFDIDDSIIEI